MTSASNSRRMRLMALAIGLVVLHSTPGQAQRVDRSWRDGSGDGAVSVVRTPGATVAAVTIAPPQRVVTQRDMLTLALFTAGALAALPLDGRLTHGLQAPRYQDNAGLRRTASIVRSAGDPGAWVLSAGVYAAGRLARRPGLADAGLHAGQAVVASGLLTAGIKLLAGRERPYATSPSEPTDADEFQLLGGYRGANASFPSGHTTVAFAAATAFSAELARTHPAASRWVSPVLYTSAAAVGASRLYHNQHWASDAIVGAAVGHFVGRALDAYHHRRHD